MAEKVDDYVRSGRCLVPVSVYPSGLHFQSLAVAALVDTGAVESAISNRLASFIGLPEVGATYIQTPTGSITGPTYGADVEIWKPGYELGHAHVFRGVRLVTMATPISGIHVLLGMDALKGCRFEVDTDGRWTLSF